MVVETLNADDAPSDEDFLQGDVDDEEDESLQLSPTSG
jgi:hypothetical protein